jgi:hypothetical protein
MALMRKFYSEKKKYQKESAALCLPKAFGTRGTKGYPNAVILRRYSSIWRWLFCLSFTRD